MTPVPAMPLTAPYAFKSVFTVVPRHERTSELGLPQALALIAVASKYDTSRAEMRGGSLDLNVNMKAAYERAIGQLNAALDALQSKPKTDDTKSSLAERVVDVWKMVLASPEIVSLIEDIKVLSGVMHLSISRKPGCPSQMISLEEPHNALMDRLECLSRASELHTLLEKIASRAAEGVPILDRSQITDIRLLLENWKAFLVKFPKESQNASFVRRFQEVVKTDDGPFMGRVYFHVWDQAVKAGENPEGDDFGERTAFEKTGRLVTAIALAGGELFAKALDLMPAHVRPDHLRKDRAFSEDAGNPTTVIPTPLVGAV